MNLFEPPLHSKAMTPLSPVEALQELQRVLKEQTDIVPEGFYTVKQLHVAWGLSISEAGRRARQAFDLGLADRQTFKVDVGHAVRGTPHYRFHAKKVKRL